MAYIIGIDTGGTYTDAVLLDPDKKRAEAVKRKAKSFTTHERLEKGIGESIEKLRLTKKEIEEESGVSRNTVSTLIDQLIELGILVPDSTYAKLGYRYKEIYDVFVGKNTI